MIFPGREGGMVHSVFGLSVLVIPVLYICIFWIIDDDDMTSLCFIDMENKKQWCWVQSVRWAVQL